MDSIEAQVTGDGGLVTVAREEIWKEGGKYSWRAGKSESKRERRERGREAGRTVEMRHCGVFECG